MESGLFDTLETSFNLVDQRARTRLFPQARARDMGIIVKRPIANSVWGAPESPSDYADTYFERAQEMIALGPIPGAPGNRILLALGFAFAHDEADTIIVGTRNLQHVKGNIEWVKKTLPIAMGVVEELHRRFEQLGQDWEQKSQARRSDLLPDVGWRIANPPYRWGCHAPRRVDV